MFFKLEIKGTGTVLKSRKYDPSNPDEVKFMEEIMESIANNSGGWVTFILDSGAKAVLCYENVSHATFFNLP